MKKYFEKNLNAIVYTTIAIISAAFVIAANAALFYFVIKHLRP